SMRADPLPERDDMGVIMSESAVAPAKVVDVLTRPPAEVPADSQPVPPPDEEQHEVVFELSGVEVSYGGVLAVHDVSIDVAANEITAFIGPSGCGKTTVLRSLNRMHDITPGAEVRGRITYHGEDLYAPK